MDKIEDKLSNMSADQLSQNAQHIWQMLDDMADNNPAAYRKFIDKQMEESKKHNAKPKPHMCVKTNLTVGCSFYTFSVTLHIYHIVNTAWTLSLIT